MNQVEAVSHISLMTDFVKENYRVISEPIYNIS